MARSIRNNYFARDQQLYISDITDDVMNSIKDVTNKNDVVFYIAQEIKKYNFADRLDLDRVFESHQSGLEAMDIQKLNRLAREEVDVYRRLTYVEAKRVRDSVPIPGFPEELLYPWKKE